MGRIVLYSILIVLFLYGHKNIFPNEANAVQLDKEAKELEEYANSLEDIQAKEEYLLLAKRKRESAQLERQSQYFQPKPLIEDTKTIHEREKTFPKPSKRWMDGIWVLQLGVGSAILDISPGPMYLQNPFLIRFLGTDFVPRAGPAYDNIFNINSSESPRKYIVTPRNFQLFYYDLEGRFGIGIQERGFRKNISYNAWNPEAPQSLSNAIQFGEFSWVESKLSLRYREDINYKKAFQYLWGLRIQSVNIVDKAALPNRPGTNEYYENNFSIAPNLGIQYIQNFFGVFLFTVGVELGLGWGGINYEQKFLRARNGDLPSSFRYLRTEKRIPMEVTGGEFYIHYDFILSENQRLGLSWNYHHFNRVTNQRHFPLIIASSPDLALLEYRRVYARTLIYNEEDNRQENLRYQILRILQLEYTILF